MKRLQQILPQIEGKNYPLYKQLKGTFSFPNFTLEMIHIQGDPFAQPTKIQISLKNSVLGITKENITNHSRRVGFEDGLLRTFTKVLKKFGKSRGSGKSGQWQIVKLGQEILPRTACEISETETVFRFCLGLPAQGRKILALEAEIMLLKELPNIVNEGLIEADQSLWLKHAKSAEDQDFLRNLIDEKPWVGFVANGSILPRASGIDDRPLIDHPVPWKSPPSLAETVQLPNLGEISGSAIPEGITLICGGGFHGKSTLLNALSRGVYNHIPGDGREFCLSSKNSVAIRAEDGRSIVGVNISPFINNLPNGKDISSFESKNASGSTSQAANIVEAIELEAKCLMIDEDTSATNFMVRDRRMQELITTNQEPITPFIDRVEDLYKKHGISTLIVIGGSGDYFSVANTIIVLKEYHPEIATDRAKEISQNYPANRLVEDRIPIEFNGARTPKIASFDPSRGNRDEQLRFHKTRAIEFGEEEIDISQISQFVDDGQAKTIGDWLIRCSRGEAGTKDIKTLCRDFENEANEFHLSKTTTGEDGDRVYVRKFEFAAAINRLRSLKIQ